MIGNLIALFSGALFAAGLAFGGMTQPDKVIGFLDFTGNWDPSLIVVMAGALLTYGIGARLVQRRRAPLDGGSFEAASSTPIDRRLVIGAALFGVGWGLGGYCPGPGIVAVGSLSLSGLLFLGGMLGGQALFEFWDRRAARSKTPEFAANGTGTTTVGVAEPTRSLPSCG